MAIGGTFPPTGSGAAGVGKQPVIVDQSGTKRLERQRDGTPGRRPGAGPVSPIQARVMPAARPRDRPPIRTDCRTGAVRPPASLTCYDRNPAKVRSFPFPAVSVLARGGRRRPVRHRRRDRASPCYKEAPDFDKQARRVVLVWSGRGPFREGQRGWAIRGQARRSPDTLRSGQGVRPEVPDETNGASDRPLSRGTATAGLWPGMVAYGRTGSSPELIGGPPAGCTPSAPTYGK